MKRKPPVDTRDLRLKVTQLFWGRRSDGSPMTTKERREAFLTLLGEWQKEVSSEGFAINRRGCFSDQLDPDLRYLIKAGKVTKHRVQGWHGTNTTYVRLP